MAKKLEWTAALLLTVLALVLHVSRFQHAGALWRDEAAAVGLATQPSLSAVFEAFPHEAFPMVFPVTVRTWVAVTGGSDTALRLFGLLVGLGILGALWWNAWTVTRHPPLVSLALLAASPPLFQFGDSLRGYGLGTLFLLLTFGLLAAAFVRPSPGSRGRLAALITGAIGATGAMALLAVHCLISNWALLAALCAAAAAVHLWRGRGREAVLALGIGLVAALSLLPYVGPLSRAREWNVVVQSPSAVGLDAVWSGLAGVAGAPVPAAKWVWVLALVLAVLGGVRIVGARPVLETEGGERGRDLALFGMLTVALGAALFFLFMEVLRYDPRPWYYLPFLALVASVFDVLIAGLGTAPGRRLALAGGALAVGAVLFLPARGAAAVRQTNADLVAQAVTRGAASGDLVLVNPWYDGISFARYYRGRAPWITLPEMTDHRFHRYDLLKARMASPRPINDVLEGIGATLAAGHRVWVVGGIHLLPPGVRPRVLPPAPGSSWRWFDVPYNVAWSQQTGAFLQAHAARAGMVDVPVPGPVSDYERQKLLVFDGWR
ncbi:MAG TPA: hypothetical protein VGR07_11325 [Thermoanaerobaculia bacterium]|nr:hypothetical protein [Thermoanaerobaculia bacterium]